MVITCQCERKIDYYIARSSTFCELTFDLYGLHAHHVTYVHMIEYSFNNLALPDRKNLPNLQCTRGSEGQQECVQEEQSESTVNINQQGYGSVLDAVEKWGGREARTAWKRVSDPLVRQGQRQLCAQKRDSVGR